MTEEKTTDSTQGPDAETTTDTTTDGTGSAPEGSSATDTAAGSSEKKSWRGRSRASKSDRAEKSEKSAKSEKSESTSETEKPAKAEKPKKEPKAAREKKEKPVAEKKRRSGGGLGASVGQVRLLVARIVWIACLVFALALAITALLIALRANADNEAVQFIVSFADKVDLGIFDLANPIKDFDRDQGPARDVKTALFNYGIGAVVWLIVGRVGDKVIRP